MKKQLCALLIFAATGTTSGMEIESEKEASQDISEFSINLLRDFIKDNNFKGIHAILTRASRDSDKDKVMKKIGYSIAFNSLEIFNAFLNWGIDINTQLEHENTLAIAIAGIPDYLDHASKEKLQILIKNPKTDLSLKNWHGYTALMNAAENGNHERLALLLESRAKDTINEKNILHRTALMEAAKNGHLECVQLLTNAGAQVNLQNDFNLTALHHCASSGDSPSIRQAEAIAKLLINNGADVNIKSNFFYGLTPCMEAAKYLLIDITWIKNADLNLQDDRGKTALMYAIQSIKNYPYIKAYKNAKLIIASGADITLKDTEGRTALDIALQIFREIKKEKEMQEKQELNPSLISNLIIYKSLQQYTKIIELLQQREGGATTLEIAKQIRDKMSKSIIPKAGIFSLYGYEPASVADMLEKNRCKLQTYNELIEMLEQQKTKA